jgi:hypothetical protein
MPPSVVNVGAVASGTGAITPAFPASIAADDILVTVAECSGATAPGAYTLPSGWAHVTGSPVQEGTNTRLWVIWRRYDGVFTAPSLGDSGDHNVGRMIALRGCPTTGNPWHITASAVSATSSTAAVWPGVTTTIPDTLVLEIIATGADVSTAQLGALTNATYTNITEQMDNWIIAGNGGGIGMVTGEKVTAGATGQSTATLTTAATKAYMTVAFTPAATGTMPQTLQRSPRPIEQGSPAGPYAEPHIASHIRPGG